MPVCFCGRAVACGVLVSPNKGKKPRFSGLLLSRDFVTDHILCFCRRTVVSGGGSLATHLDDFFEVIGLPVLNGWGLTETSPVLACRRAVQVRLHSVLWADART